MKYKLNDTIIDMMILLNTTSKYKNTGLLISVKCLNKSQMSRNEARSCVILSIYVYVSILIYIKIIVKMIIHMIIKIMGQQYHN